MVPRISLFATGPTKMKENYKVSVLSGIWYLEKTLITEFKGEMFNSHYKLFITIELQSANQLVVPRQ